MKDCAAVFGFVVTHWSMKELVLKLLTIKLKPNFQKPSTLNYKQVNYYYTIRNK